MRERKEHGANTLFPKKKKSKIEKKKKRGTWSFVVKPKNSKIGISVIYVCVCARVKDEKLGIFPDVRCYKISNDAA